MNSRTVRALQLKAAWRATVDAGPHPAKALADLVGVSYPQWQAYGDPSINQHCPLHRVPRVLAVCPDLSLVRYLAGIQGAVVLRQEGTAPEVLSLALDAWLQGGPKPVRREA